MPTYEYKCKSCEVIQERIHGMKEKPTVTCKSCGSKDTRKVIQSTSFSMKNTIAKNKFTSNAKKQHEMKLDLQHNYDIHETIPVSPNETQENIYNYVKKNSDRVKDKMDAEREAGEVKSRKKLDKWHKEASARVKRDEPKLKKEFLEKAAKRKQSKK
jgi:putative FmdB family regulatory protein